MGFSFNGNTPNEITFNGNDVLVLKWNGTTVWEKSASHDYSEDYLTFVAKTSGTFVFSGTSTSNTISYSTDNGNTWSTSSQGGTINVNANDIVLWKGNLRISGNSGVCRFSGGTASFDVQGNIMSLLYGDNFVGKTSISDSYLFFALFQSAKIVNAENLILPATTLYYGCYNSMFSGCTSLITAPQLPATTLAQYCYQSMFQGCTSLTTAPDLLAPTLANRCYYYMFYGCTKLNYIKMLATDVSATNPFYYWVRNVASSGTFVKYSSTSINRGNNGIPNGWTIVNI